MGKKMKLPFLSKSSQATPSWAWPSCKDPKTHSFRSTAIIPNTGNESDFSPTCMKLDEKLEKYARDTTKPCSQILFGHIPDSIWLEGAVEEVIIGLRSEDRLVFDPGETRSIVEEANNYSSPFNESVALVMDSQDPYIDFRKSMEEMVEAHDLRDWDNLEELFNWYLRVNEESTHGYVIGAFVDLLVSLSFSAHIDDEYHGESSTTSPYDSLSSPLSFSFSTISNSPCLSTEMVENDVEKEVNSGS